MLRRVVRPGFGSGRKNELPSSSPQYQLGCISQSSAALRHGLPAASPDAPRASLTQSEEVSITAPDYRSPSPSLSPEAASKALDVF